MAQAELGPRSILFWLVALIGIGIIFVGGRFVVAPAVGAAGFGVPAEGTQVAYLWAKGARDVVWGLLLFALLGMHAGRRVIAAFISVAALIPIADFVNVSLHGGSSSAPALVIHGSTAVFMLVLGGVLWTRPRG